MWKPEQRGARGHRRKGATEAPWDVPEGRRPHGMEEEEFPAEIPSETVCPLAGKMQVCTAALGRD